MCGKIIVLNIKKKNEYQAYVAINLICAYLCASLFLPVIQFMLLF